MRYLLERPTTLIGGPVDVLELPDDLTFRERRLTPAALRAAITERGWRTVAGFHTRKPIHRAHEYQTKIALEICDGLVIDPLVGTTSEYDVPAEVRVRAYDLLLEPITRVGARCSRCSRARRATLALARRCSTRLSARTAASRT